MEWLTEKKVLATWDINSNSAGETEELIEKQEKVIDNLDKKRKVKNRKLILIIQQSIYIQRFFKKLLAKAVN